MFCSECGVEASGRYCSQCGAKLPTHSNVSRTAPAQPAYPDPAISQTWDEEDLPDIGDTILEEDGLASLSMYDESSLDFANEPAPAFEGLPQGSPRADEDIDFEGATHIELPPARSRSQNDETIVADWAYEVDYLTLAEQPWVRQQLQFAANRASGGVSADKWLGLFDNIVPGTSLVAIAVQPLYAQLGVQTGKTEATVVSKPIGLAMFEVLKFLAENGQQLIEVQQAEDGCLLVATIPSDIWSFKGTLYVQLQFAGDETPVELRTVIPGQMFDWGKSTRLLDRVLGALRDAA